MREAGAALLEELTRAAAIGPADALRHFGLLRRAARRLDEELARRRPDLAVLVDFGDYNLPVIAPILKRHGVRIAYFTSPQVWAWGRWRLRSIRRHVERMLVFFAFEEAFYREAGVPVTWVGHPLVGECRPSMAPEAARNHYGLAQVRATVGLLPGSRRAELGRHLPLMLRAAERLAWDLPGAQFLVPLAAGLDPEPVRRAASRARADIVVASGGMADALSVMDAAIVASGTATLETALAGVPMAVVYRMPWLTYLPARALVRTKHIAMVNVIAGREVVPEFIQHRATPRRLARAVAGLLADAQARERMRAELRAVTDQLGAPGAIERAADCILELLQRT